MLTGYTDFITKKVAPENHGTRRCSLRIAVDSGAPGKCERMRLSCAGWTSPIGRSAESWDGAAPRAIKGEHRFQLLVKSRSRKQLRKVVDTALGAVVARGQNLRGINLEIDPVSIM